MTDYEKLTLCVRILAIIVTAILAIVTFSSWKRQQRLLRKSTIAQGVLKAQVAFRLKIKNTIEPLISMVMLSNIEAGTEAIIREAAVGCQSAVDDRYIYLIEQLTLFKLMCENGVEEIIGQYKKIYDDICGIITNLSMMISAPSKNDVSVMRALKEVDAAMLEIESDEKIKRQII